MPSLLTVKQTPTINSSEPGFHSIGFLLEVQSLPLVMLNTRISLLELSSNNACKHKQVTRKIKHFPSAKQAARRLEGVPSDVNHPCRDIRC